MEEFYLVYKKLGFKFSQEQIENMVASISKSHEREIDLHEFVRLSQQIVKRHQRVISFEDELKMAFKVFDIDGDGFITAKELSKTLRGSKFFQKFCINFFCQVSFGPKCYR